MEMILLISVSAFVETVDVVGYLHQPIALFGLSRFVSSTYNLITAYSRDLLAHYCKTPVGKPLPSAVAHIKRATSFVYNKTTTLLTGTSQNDYITLEATVSHPQLPEHNPQNKSIKK